MLSGCKKQPPLQKTPSTAVTRQGEFPDTTTARTPDTRGRRPWRVPAGAEAADGTSSGDSAKTRPFESWKGKHTIVRQPIDNPITAEIRNLDPAP